MSDAEREQALVRLREQTVAGRLTLEEFSDRADQALAARTRAELEVATQALPAVPVPAGRARRFILMLLGSAQRRGRWHVPDRIWAVSLIGAPDLDLRHAVIGSSEVRITSVSIMGALTALVPRGVDVDLGGVALIGGNDLFAEGEPQATEGGGPKIRIRSYALFGGARVTLVGPTTEPRRELPP